MSIILDKSLGPFWVLLGGEVQYWPPWSCWPWSCWPWSCRPWSCWPWLCWPLSCWPWLGESNDWEAWRAEEEERQGKGQENIDEGQETGNDADEDDDGNADADEDDDDNADENTDDNADENAKMTMIMLMLILKTPFSRWADRTNGEWRVTIKPITCFSTSPRVDSFHLSPSFIVTV